LGKLGEALDNLATGSDEEVADVVSDLLSLTLLKNLANTLKDVGVPSQFLLF